MSLCDDYPLIQATSSRTPTWFWDGKEGIILDNNLINSLLDYSVNSNTNCRICFHSSPEELSHNMLIVEQKGMNIPQHFHKDKSDSIFILKGEMHFFEFNSDSSIKKKLVLNELSGYKSPSNQIHGVGIGSTRCVYLETSAGPFVPKNDAIYLDWSQEWHKNYLASLFS